jgi:hypothetical protein
MPPRHQPPANHSVSRNHPVSTRSPLRGRSTSPSGPNVAATGRATRPRGSAGPDGRLPVEGTGSRLDLTHRIDRRGSARSGEQEGVADHLDQLHLSAGGVGGKLAEPSRHASEILGRPFLLLWSTIVGVMIGVLPAIGRTLPKALVDDELERRGRHADQLVGKSPYLQPVHLAENGIKFGDVVNALIDGVGSNSLSAHIAGRSG